MNSWRSLLGHASPGLIALGLALAAGLILILGSQYAHERARNKLARTRADLTALHTVLREKQADLIQVQTQIERFRRLTQLGLIGTPDRADWVEQLVDSHRRRGLPNTLSYTLHTPKPVSTQTSSTVSPTTEAAPGDGAGESQFHDLEFKLTGVHEEELLTLLQDFEAHVTGRFRVNACQLSERTPQGLTAQCSLRFFTLPLDGAVAATHSPAAVAAIDIDPASAPHLDALLYSPAERDMLVHERSGDAPDGFNTRLRVSGIVKRDRGHSTAWINYQSVAEGQSLPPTRGTTISATGVTLDGQRVRVGETLDVSTRERSDVVNSGALTVKERK